jgi:hypothetical protein
VKRILLATALALLPSIGQAQVWEVGATVAAGCLGSDGSACGTGTRPMPGAHASVWLGDRLEIAARAARVGLPDYRSSSVFPNPVSYDVTDRSRAFLSGLLIYHYRRGQAVRPMLGLGYGAFARAERIRCEPVGCDAVFGPAEGHQRTWMNDILVVAGLSGRVRDRWTLRGGVLTHRLFNDENSTIEFFAGAGYRF